METLINPNQLGNRPKVLNVIKNGNLNRNGSWISGFTDTTNYLTLCSRFNNGVLLDSDWYNISFSETASNASSWETVFKIKSPENASPDGILFGARTFFTGATLSYIKNSKFSFRISISDSTGMDGIGTTTLSPNTIYYLKIVYSSEAGKYTGYLSTTGTFSGEETTEFTVTTNTKVTNQGVYAIGSYSLDSGYTNFSVDLSESYIKINGEYWWKGVETL